jgi:hypothetical protein
VDIEQVDPKLEINREGVTVVTDGFRGFTLLAHQIMIEEGVGTDDGEGNLVLPPGAWLTLRKYLLALRRIEQEVGATVLRDAGQTVPKHAQLPPTIVDIYSGLGSLDIAYHMNHRKFGKPLFDPSTGTVDEGIGHYYFKGKQGDSKVEVNSDTPYPCAYDHGIVIGMSQRFKPNSQVTHGPSCRGKGAASCTYAVTWK